FGGDGPRTTVRTVISPIRVTAVLAVALRKRNFIELCAAQPPTRRKERDRLQHIGLAGAVRTSERHQTCLRRHGGRAIVAEIGEGQSAYAGGAGHDSASAPSLPSALGARASRPHRDAKLALALPCVKMRAGRPRSQGAG